MKPKKAATAQMAQAEVAKEVLTIRDIRGELLTLLKAKMPACFDREPQGMNSGVEKLTDSILELLK